MTKTPRTDKQAWFHSGIEVIYASTARELELELAAKDAECRLKVIEALEDARESVESDTDPRRVHYGIRALIEKRKGEQK